MVVELLLISCDSSRSHRLYAGQTYEPVVQPHSPLVHLLSLSTELLTLEKRVKGDQPERCRHE
jgi:hypothetical protein